MVKRDKWLLLALLLFTSAAALLAFQAWVATLYHFSAVANNWTQFVKWFPSAAQPPTAPGMVCFDDCSPDLPLVAGWLGSVSFILGLATLAYRWWTSELRMP